MVDYNAFPEVKYSLIRSNGLVTKRFTITPEGLNKIGNPPGISGDVETRYIPLNELILNQDPRVCHAYGLVSPDIGHKVPIAPKAFSGGDVKARTKEHFSFYDGPGVLFLDNDPNPDAVPPVAAYAPDELISLLEKHVPGIRPAVAYVSAHSSGAGDIIDSATGETLRQSRGIHVYLAVDDAREIPQIGETIFKRLWLAGYGCIAFAKNGAMLVRCPIDGSVFSPERIDYTCPAILGPGLERKPLDALLQRPGDPVRANEVLDLTAEEEKQFDKLVTEAKNQARVQSGAIRAKFIKDKTDEFINAGNSPEVAMATAERACGGDKVDLYGDYLLNFGCMIRPVSVAEVLADPERFNEQSLADPLEGIAKGLTKARFFANKGKPVVNSYAYGGMTYFLHKESAGPNPSGDDIHIAPDDLLLTQGTPTQDQIATVFEHTFKGKFLFDHTGSKWLEWNGHRWAEDPTCRVFDLIRKIARQRNPSGKASAASANFVAGVEKMARHSKVFSAVIAEFDQDNWLLNTPDGVIDLRDNSIRASMPEDRLTKITSVGPSVHGGHRFLKFMNEITCGDQELIRFHQVSLGACLSGARGGHWMLFWIGGGRNGKNTLGDLFDYILGSYSSKIPASTLMAKHFEGHPTEIAQLQGLRLATSSEVNEGDFWHESRINELTGDATAKARFMRGDFFEFELTHKHLIYGNHRPQIRSATDALKSRIKLVPFKASFVGKEQADLPDQLRREAAFVLEWLLEGHAAWLALGKKLPACNAVDAESADYFASQSTIDAWILERTEPSISGVASRWPLITDLYKDFVEWKKSRGEVPPAQVRFSEALKVRHEVKRANGMRVGGIKLLPVIVSAYRTGTY